MIERLEQAIAEIRKLPPNTQNRIADIIFEELHQTRPLRAAKAGDLRWEELFADPRSQDALSALADEALLEIEAGHFVKKGFDEL